jgi:hypothetical protein
MRDGGCCPGGKVEFGEQVAEVADGRPSRNPVAAGEGCF